MLSTCTRWRIFSGDIRMSFALQSRFAPKRRKCRRTRQRSSRGDFSSPKAIVTLLFASRRYLPDTSHAQKPSNCPRANKRRNGKDSRAGSSRLSRFAHRWLHFTDCACDSMAKNYGVEQTDGAWLLFLDDRIEVIERDWLMIMAEHIQRTEIGAIGAQVINSSG